MPEARRSIPTVEEVTLEILRGLDQQLRESGVPVPALSPDTDLFQDLALDSLTLTALVVSLEDHYRVILQDEDAAEVHTVAALAALVVRRIQEQV